MVAFIIGFCASNIQVARLFATADTKNVASQKVLKKNGFQKVANIDIETHDGDSRASFLFERAMKLGELQSADNKRGQQIAMGVAEYTRGLVLSSVHFMEPASAGIIGTSAFISSRSQKFEEDYRKYAYNASARRLVRLRRNTEEPSLLFGTAIQEI